MHPSTLEEGRGLLDRARAGKWSTSPMHLAHTMLFVGVELPQIVRLQASIIIYLCTES